MFSVFFSVLKLKFYSNKKTSSKTHENGALEHTVKPGYNELGY